MVTLCKVIDAYPPLIVFDEIVFDKPSTSAAEPVSYEKHIFPVSEDQRRELAARARSDLVAKYAHLEPLDCRSHVHHVASEPND
jgi:hypothetical protein